MDYVTWWTWIHWHQCSVLCYWQHADAKLYGMCSRDFVLPESVNFSWFYRKTKWQCKNGGWQYRLLRNALIAWHFYNLELPRLHYIRRRCQLMLELHRLHSFPLSSPFGFCCHNPFRYWLSNQVLFCSYTISAVNLTHMSDVPVSLLSSRLLSLHLNLLTLPHPYQRCLRFRFSFRANIRFRFILLASNQLSAFYIWCLFTQLSVAH